MTRRTTFWLVQAGAWGAYGLSTFLTHLPTLETAEYLPWLAMKLIRAGMGLGASLLLLALYRRMLARGTSPGALGAAAVAASAALGAAWFILYRLLVAPLRATPGPAIDWAAFPRTALDFGFLLLAWSIAYFGARAWAAGQRREREAAAALGLARDAQLQMLRYQLNPHFLFNAMNSIRSLIQEDPARARDMVTQLSAFFRYALVRDPGTLVPLAGELEVLEGYLAIEKIRYEERLEVSTRIEPGAELCGIPGFLIHPLLENAVKHGMRTSARPLRVRVSAQVRDGWLRVEVGNTGRLGEAPAGADPASEGTGTGLGNVRDRLLRQFPGRHRFAVSEDGGWVRARIEIPAVAVGRQGAAYA